MSETAFYPGEATPKLVRAIWWRDDVDAALAAAALHEPIRGTLVERGDLTGEYVGRHRAPDSRTTRFLFTRSRFRRAQVHDALAVALLMALMAALGVITYAATAKADPDNTAIAWAAEYGPAVCQNLDDHDSVAGMYGTGRGIMDQGLTAEQAGQVIFFSVNEICPRHFDLLARFIQRYTAVTT